MIKPFFSIIIPVYNLEKYISFTLESVLAQTEESWECICIDDGSIDSSWEILEDFSRKDQRFVIIRQANGGASVARNMGLAKARGQFVAFLDGDDLIAEDWLAQYRYLFNVTSADLVRIKFVEWIDGESEPKLSHVNGNKYRVYSTKKEIFSKFSPLLFKEGYVWQYCVRAEIAKNVVFQIRTAFMEDFLYTCDLLRLLDSVCQSEYVGYKYRQRVGSVRYRKIPSKEWENLVKAVRRLMIIYSRDMQKYEASCMLPLLTRFLWSSISAWIRSPADNKCSKSIHVIVKDLEDMGLFSISYIKPVWWWGVFTYIKFGWHWPTRVLCRLIPVKERIHKWWKLSHSFLSIAKEFT